METERQEDMVEPCQCTGSVRAAHMECLKAWCMENLSLKCEICGCVYKDGVVSALMATLLEAQDRHIAMHGFHSLDTGAHCSRAAQPRTRLRAWRLQLLAPVMSCLCITEVAPVHCTSGWPCYRNTCTTACRLATLAPALQRLNRVVHDINMS